MHMIYTITHMSSVVNHLSGSEEKGGWQQSSKHFNIFSYNYASFKSSCGIWEDWLEWNQCSTQVCLYQRTPEICSCQMKNPHTHPQSSSIYTPAHEYVVQWLEPVETKRILCGGVSKDHVRVVEHVQTIKRQWVDFEIVQRELGVNVKIHICGQRASQVLGQAGGRLSTHWTGTRQQINKRIICKRRQ